MAVLLRREGEHAVVVQSGQEITRDPRRLDLTPGVDEMVALAEDPRLRLRTSPAAIELGEELGDGEAPD